MDNYFSPELGFNQYKPKAIDLLNQTINILNDFNINHFLISGTLLGYIRHNDFIPWDDDIDLLVDNSIFNKLDDIVAKYNDINLFFKNVNDSVKICFKEGQLVSEYSDWNDKCVNNKGKYTWPFIDLFVYEYGPGLHACGEWGDVVIMGLNQRIFKPFSGPCDSCFRIIRDDEIVFFHNTWKKINFFPPQHVDFLGIKCNIPNNPNHFLSRNYGNNYMKIAESSSRIHKTDSEILNIIKINYDDIRRY